MTATPAGEPPSGGSTDAALMAVLERSRSLGFLGPGSLRVQVAHARGFAAAVRTAPLRVLDLGSGGGVPGLVLAAQWASSEVVLLDAAERRCAFLAESVASLGWADRVRVVRSRAEVAGRREDLRGRFDVVVARGFGPPAVTAECGAPFLVVGGRLVVSEPPVVTGGGAPAVARHGRDAAVRGHRAAGSGPVAGDGSTVEAPVGAADAAADPGARPLAADRWPAEGVALVGLRPEREWSDPYHYRSLVLERTCPARFPRRTGVPAKRPLF
jgi:16S rRNA (guanine527-N7)-methyltransferase